MKKPVIPTLLAASVVLLGIIVYGLVFVGDTNPSNTKEKAFSLDLLPKEVAADDNPVSSDVMERLILILVNKSNRLPDDFEVDLTSVGDARVASILLNDLIEMRNAATSDGVSLFITSGYRTAEEQEYIFNVTVANFVNQGYSEYLARDMAALPGYSEHQTGLAIDFSGGDNQDAMWTWLFNNAYRFGFIQRYPEGGRRATDYQYEPWHYRYVGKEHAKKIFELGVTLEEYLGISNDGSYQSPGQPGREL